MTPALKPPQTILDFTTGKSITLKAASSPLSPASLSQRTKNLRPSKLESKQKNARLNSTKQTIPDEDCTLTASFYRAFLVSVTHISLRQSHRQLLLYRPWSPARATSARHYLVFVARV